MPVIKRKPKSREEHIKRGYCCGHKCKNCPYDGTRGSKEILRHDTAFVGQNDKVDSSLVINTLKIS